MYFFGLMADFSVRDMFPSTTKTSCLRAVIAGIATVLVTTAAFGLDPRTPLTEYGRRLWRFDDGLPNTACRAFAQTPDGYMWIGTQEGAARFDGARFVPVGSTSMRNAWVYAMTVGADGALWIGAGMPGLIRYQKGVDKAFKELKAFGTDDVLSLANGPDKALWLGTNVGLIRRDANGTLRLWSKKDGLPSSLIESLLFDRQGTLWIGTERGLVKLSNGSITPVAGMPPRAIRSLAEDARGALWIGTNQGVFCLDHGVFVDHPVLHDLADLFVATILEDSAHTLWFGTNSGLKRLKADGTSDPVTAAGLASAFIRALFEDREHNLWVGTMDGVTQLRDTAFRMYGAAEGFRDGAVLSLTEDNDGAVWLGFYDGLVRMAGGKQHLFRREDGLSNNTMVSMAPSRLGGVWVATYGGGVCHVREGSRPRCYGEAEGLRNGVARAVYEDNKGGVWVATTAGGVNYLENGRVQTFGVAAGLPTPSGIITIAPAQNGGLWLGDVRQGVFLFKDGHVVRHVGPAGVSAPRCILEQPDGDLWIAYEWGGLILVKDGKVTEFPLPTYGGRNKILSVVDGGAFLWVTTARNVLRLEKGELIAYAAGRTKAIHPTICGPSEGMTSSEFPRSQASAFRARDGSIWFNGSKGAARLDLRAFGASQPAPPVALVESVTAAGRELSADHPIVDGRGVRLLFRYTANSFADADQLTFRYKLDGYDSGWIDAGKTRSAVYTNLPPGHYIFRVVSGTNGKWSDAGMAAFAFSRRPSLTETKWFYAACVLGLVGLVSLGFRARVRALKLRELTLARRVQEQTVTLRHQTEELTELSAKQSMILGSAGDGIIGLDAAGRISFINPSGAQMLGWSIDELLGRALHELIHSSSIETEGPAEACFVCGTADPPVRAAKGDLFRSRSGKSIPVELTSSTITTGGAGRPIGVVVTFRDITERHELERMKSEFVSTVSHELRTPLTSIRGALGLLAGGLMGSFEPKAKRMLDIATTNCDRLVRLINDILDIERIESGRVELERKPTDGEKLLVQAAETMQAMADRAGVRLEVGAAPGVVDIDPDRVLQVITNLLGNAFKFSSAGSSVTLTSDCHDGVFSVHVSDQGRGIPQEKLALIFERFQQVDTSDARDKGGTGLGLAICRSIARAHGGDISVESTVGVGSTFHLRIPAQGVIVPALAGSPHGLPPRRL